MAIQIYTSVADVVWLSDTAIICTDEQFVTIQIKTAESSFADTLYSVPRQLPGYAEHKVFVGKGNKLTVTGLGTITVMVGNN